MYVGHITTNNRFPRCTDKQREIYDGTGRMNLEPYQKSKNNIIVWRFLIMESIRVSKKEIIRFRVAELLRKVNKFVKSFSYRMEVIR